MVIIFEKQIKISKSEGKERKKRYIQNKTKISESNQTYWDFAHVA